MTEPTSQLEPAWVRTISNNRSVFGGISLALTAVAVGLIFVAGTERPMIIAWCVFMAALFLGNGVYLILSNRDGIQPSTDVRILALFLGGLTGFATTFFLGLGMAWYWRVHLLANWSEWQGKRGGFVIGSLVGGLALMFITLQMTRGDEHGDPLLRRVVHGSNVFLTACLILLILIGFNALIYTDLQPFASLNKEHFWVASSIYSLSEKSERIVRGLKQPLKVVVCISKNDQAYQPTRALLNNCEAINSKVSSEFLSPDRQADEWERYAKQYNIGDREGVLLLYGTEPKVTHRFVRYDDLTSIGSAGSKVMLFNGESTIISEVRALAEADEEGTKPVVYFTQGNGEVDLHNTRVGQRDDGAGLLKQLLESRYEVKGLQLREVEAPSDKDVVAKEVPADAAIVVVAGAQTKFTDFAMKALRDYLEPSQPERKKGRMIVLFTQTVANNMMEHVGMESLARDYGVGVGENKIWRYPEGGGSPAMIVVTPPKDSTNPLIKAFEGHRFMFFWPRTVDPSDKTGTSKYQVAKLLETSRRQLCLAETNLTNDPRVILNDPNLEKKIAKDPLSVACVVSEKHEGTDHHEGVTMGETPRMIFFGDVAWITNRAMGTAQSTNESADFFNSCLGWLREKPLDIGIEPRKSDVYRLDSSADTRSMVWMPAMLMLVGIVGVGTSVWVVRRR